MTKCVRDRVLPTIENYLTLTGISPEALGRNAVNNPLCIPRLREGGKLLERTAGALLDYVLGHLEEMLAESATFREVSARFFQEAA